MASSEQLAAERKRANAGAIDRYEATLDALEVERRHVLETDPNLRDDPAAEPTAATARRLTEIDAEIARVELAGPQEKR